jgi:serine/threonine protein kinase
MIGKYRIVRHIADGGAGEVYLAEDNGLKRQVAIKFLRHESAKDELANKRLTREAQAAACLDHPNICTIHEVGEAEGRSFIVMQYVRLTEGRMGEAPPRPTLGVNQSRPQTNQPLLFREASRKSGWFPAGIGARFWPAFETVDS